MKNSKTKKPKATVRVNNGREIDLDEAMQDGTAAQKDFQVEVAKMLQRQEEKAREQGVGFSATLEKTSQDRDGEQTVVLKVPRTDRLAVNILSHWDSEPLAVVIAVKPHHKQGNLFGDNAKESEDED